MLRAFSSFYSATSTHFLSCTFVFLFAAPCDLSRGQRAKLDAYDITPLSLTTADHQHQHQHFSSSFQPLRDLLSFRNHGVAPDSCIELCLPLYARHHLLTPLQRFLTLYRVTEISARRSSHRIDLVRP